MISGAPRLRDDLVESFDCLIEHIPARMEPRNALARAGWKGDFVHRLPASQAFGHRGAKRVERARAHATDVAPADAQRRSRRVGGLLEFDLGGGRLVRALRDYVHDDVGQVDGRSFGDLVVGAG